MAASTVLPPKHKSTERVFRKLPLAIAISTLSYFSTLPIAKAGPDGGNVVGGTGSIHQGGNVTTVHQNSQRLAIDWQNFDLAIDERVDFIQPSHSSVALNRILSNRGSEINGSINANGHVFLINPNGVVFGENAQINVGGLLASGLSIDADDFMNGEFVFESLLDTDGAVVSSGTLSAATGGSISLLGRTVENNGLIRADLGRINLASGNEAIVSFDGGLLNVKVTEAVLQDDLGLDPGVLNSGDLYSEGGQVLLTGAASRNVFTQALNTGESQARSIVVDDSGVITLSASGSNVVNTGRITTSSENDGGQIALLGENITHSGEIDASVIQGNAGEVELHSISTTEVIDTGLITATATEQGEGGSVNILGSRVGLLDSANINASGADAGGEILIGGGQTGNNHFVPNAEFIFLSDESNVQADALNHGNGGRVIAFAENSARIYGHFSARGGSESGDGGFIETSGLIGLDLRSAPEVSAPNGVAGEWLIDPYNITIVDGFVGSGLGITLDEDDITYSAIETGAQIGWDVILSTLIDDAAVTIQTSANPDSGSELGNITFDLAGDGSGGSVDFRFLGATLTNAALNLIADNDIIFQNQSLNAIEDDQLHLSLTAAQNIRFNGNSQINLNGGNFTATSQNFILGAQGTSTAGINTGGGNLNIYADGDVLFYDDVTTGGGSFSVLGRALSPIDPIAPDNPRVRAASFSSFFLGDADQGLIQDQGIINTFNNSGGRGNINVQTSGDITFGDIRTGATSGYEDLVLTFNSLGSIAQLGYVNVDSDLEGDGPGSTSYLTRFSLVANNDVRLGNNAIYDNGPNSGNRSNIAFDAGNDGTGRVIIAGNVSGIDALDTNVFTGGGTITITGEHFQVGNAQDNSVGQIDSEGGLIDIDVTNTVTLFANQSNLIVPDAYTEGTEAIKTNGGDLEIDAVGITDIGSISTNALTVNTSGEIRQTSGAIIASGLASFDANVNGDDAANIILTSSDNDFQNGVQIIEGANVSLANSNSLVLGDMTSADDVSLITGTFSATANSGTITDVGDWTFEQGASFTALNNAITLDDENNFGGSVFVSGTNVYLNDTQGNLDLGSNTGTSIVTGSLIANTPGSITQSGALDVSGTSTLTVGAGQSITLRNASNRFSNTITFNTSSGNIQNLSIFDTTALTLQNNLSIGGNLLVDAEGITFGAGTTTVDGMVISTATGAGSIASQGNFSVTETSSFTALGNAITLNNTSNNFVDAVSIDTHSEDPTIAGGAIDLNGQSLVLENILAYGADNESGAGGDAGTISVTGVDITTQGRIEAAGGRGNNPGINDGSSQIITLNGNNSVNVFTFNAGSNWTGLSFTVNGENDRDIFYLNTPLMGVTLNGNAGRDTFNINAEFNGTINGNLNPDIFNISANATTLSGDGHNDEFNILVPGITVSIDGTGNVDTDTLTINHEEQSYNWTFNTDDDDGFEASDNGATPGTISFEEIEIINSNNQADNITFNTDFAGRFNALNGENVFNFYSSVTGEISGGIDRDEVYIRTDSIALTNDLDMGAGDDVFNINASVTGNFLGATGNDQFIVAAGATVSGTLNGGNDTDSLQVIGAEASTTSWVLSALENTVTGVTNFLSFENLIGSEAVDNFSISREVSINSIDGRSNNDELTVTSAADTDNVINVSWNITANNEGDVSGVLNRFTSIETLQGGEGDDQFNVLNNAASATVRGGGDNDTLVSASTGTNAWESTDDEAGELDNTGTVRFDDIETLRGGSATDNFILGHNFTRVEGGNGTNRYSITAAGLTTQIVGGANTDTLVGLTSAGNTWTVSNENTLVAGGTGSITFEQINVLQGGDAGNSFTISRDFNGRILGGAAADTVNLSASVSDNNTGTIDIELGAASDEINLLAGGIEASIDAGENDTDILRGYSDTENRNDWSINATTSSITNNGGVVQFTNVDSLVGGDAVGGRGGEDRFTLNTDFQGTINAGSGNDQITLNTSQTRELLGGAGNDTFIIEQNDVVASVRGGEGANTLTVNYGDVDRVAWSFVGANSGQVQAENSEPAVVLGTVTFYDMNIVEGAQANNEGLGGVDTFTLTQNFTGEIRSRSGNDIFNINTLITTVMNAGAGDDQFIMGAEGVANTTLDGGADSDTLIGRNQNSYWNITGVNQGAVFEDTGSVNPETDTPYVTNFASIENLEGQQQNDNFVFAINNSDITGSINGGVDGSDRLNYSERSSVVIDLADGALNQISDIEIIEGSGTGTTLIGENNANTWSITGDNEGNVDGLTFINIANLVGGTDVDTFTVDGGRITGSLSGTRQTDSLGSSVADNSNDSLTITSANDESVSWAINNGGSSATGVAQFDGIETFVGSAGDDQFTVLSSEQINSIDGGAGTNGLTVNSPAESTVRWNIDGEDPSAVEGVITEFSAIQSLQGGDGNDVFTLNIDIAGGVSGGEGNDQFNIYSTLTGQLRGEGGDDQFNVMGTFSAVIFGGETGTDNDSLQSSTFSEVTNWTSSQNDEAGSYTNTATVTFNQIENLSGGGGEDRFTLNHSFASVAGNGGTDRFDINVLINGLIRGGESQDRFNVNADVTGGIQGNEGDDVFTIAGGLTTVIDGGTNALNGDQIILNETTGEYTWLIDGANSGRLDNTLTFNEIEDIDGADGGGVDTFRFNIADGGVFNGEIDARGGSDIVDVSLANAPNRITLTPGSIIFGVTNATTVIGDGATTELVATGSDLTTWQVINFDPEQVDGVNDGVVISSGLSTRFINMVNLTGSDANDELTVEASGTFAGNFNGDGGRNQLTLTTGGNTWLLNSENAYRGAVGAINFRDVQVLNGAGADTLTGRNQANTWQLNETTNTVAESIDIPEDTVTFTGMRTLQGGNGVDTFNVQNSQDWLINGGEENDTFNLAVIDSAAFFDGEEGTDTVSVTYATNGSRWVVDGEGEFETVVAINTEGEAVGSTVNFQGVERLIGNNELDAFIISASLNEVLALGGDDQLTLNALIENDINLGAGNDTATIGSAGLNINLLGGEGSDQIVVTHAEDNVWTIDGDNSQVVDQGVSGGTVSFRDFERVTSNHESAVDRVTVRTALESLNTQGGNDEITLRANITDGVEETVDLNTGEGDDRITVQNADISFSLDAGNGGDSLVVGYDADTQWQMASEDNNSLQASRAGTELGAITFDSIENVTGSLQGNDNFNLSYGINRLNAQDGDNVLTLNEGADIQFEASFGSGEDQILLGDSVAARLTLGNGADQVTVTTTENITANIDAGGSLDDTLTGANRFNIWRMTNTGGTLNLVSDPVSGIVFNGFEHFVGGILQDQFTLEAVITGSVRGIADGVTEDIAIHDTLIVASDVDQVVDWRITGENAGTVFAVEGGFTSIENLTGGSGQDNFTFDSANTNLAGVIDGGESIGVLGEVQDSVNFSVFQNGLIVEIGPDSQPGHSVPTLPNAANVQVHNVESLAAFEGSNEQEANQWLVITHGYDIEWDITAFNEGTVQQIDIEGATGEEDFLPIANTPINFYNFGSFDSGSGADFSNIFPSSNISGTYIFGLGGANLNYSRAFDPEGNPLFVAVELSSSIKSLTGNNNTLIFISSEDAELNGANEWRINAENAGVFTALSNEPDPFTLEFEGVNFLHGGASNDRFVFETQGTLVDGSIHGGSGGVNEVLTNDSTLPFTFGVNELTQRIVNVSNMPEIRGQEITVIANRADVIDVFNVASLTGNDHEQSIMVSGDQAEYTWNVGLTEDRLVGNGQDVTFTGMRQYRGGAGDDAFIVHTADAIEGRLSGGEGDDRFDVRNINVDVSVSVNTQRLEEDALNITDFETIQANTENTNTLVADDTINVWTIEGTNAGQLNAIQFSGFANLQGGANTDTVYLDGSDQITGWIDAGQQSDAIVDTLDFQQMDQAVRVSLDQTAEADLHVSGFDTINGSNLNNTLIANGEQDNNWQINGTNAGQLNVISFTGMANLVGASTQDVFVLNGDDSITGIIDGGAGNARDRVDLTEMNTDVVVSLDSERDADIKLTNVEVIDTNTTNTNTLIGEKSANRWNIDEANAGEVNGVSFTGIANLIGNTLQDIFYVTDTGSVSGQIDGGENATGGDELNLSELTNAVSVSLAQEQDADFYLENIESIKANNIAGNTLIGFDRDTHWLINNENQGRINQTIDFENFDRLVGLSGVDRFEFIAQGHITGRVDGGVQPDGQRDQADFSGLNQVEVLLGDREGGIQNIESLVGNNTNSLLIAEDRENTWSLTEGENDGTLNSTVFENFNHLQGGALTDRFIVDGGSLVGGQMNAGEGNDALTLSIQNGVTGEVAFLGGEGQDSVEVIGGGEGVTTGYSINDESLSQHEYRSSQSIYTLAYDEVESVSDQVVSDGLTVDIRSEGEDVLLLVDNRFRVNNQVLVDYSNKRDLTVEGGIEDTVNVEGTVNFAQGTVDIQNVEVAGSATSLLNSETFILDNNAGVGNALTPLRIDTNSLRVTNTSNPVFISDVDDLVIDTLSNLSGITNIFAQTDITQSNPLNVQGELTLQSETGSIVVDQENNLTNIVNLSAGEDITLNNSVVTRLGAIEAQNFSLRSNGAVTDDDEGTLRVENVTTLVATGFDIDLNDVTNDLNQVVVTDARSIEISDANALSVSGTVNQGWDVYAEGAVTTLQSLEGRTIDLVSNTESVTVNHSVTAEEYVSMSGQGVIVNNAIRVDESLLGNDDGNAIEINAKDGAAIIAASLTAQAAGNVNTHVSIAGNTILQSRGVDITAGKLFANAQNELELNATIRVNEADLRVSSGGLRMMDGASLFVTDALAITTNAPTVLERIDAGTTRIVSGGSVQHDATIDSLQGYSAEVGGDFTVASGADMNVNDGVAFIRAQGNTILQTLTADTVSVSGESVQIDGVVTSDAGEMELTAIDNVFINNTLNAAQNIQVTANEGDIVQRGDIIAGTTVAFESGNNIAMDPTVSLNAETGVDFGAANNIQISSISTAEGGVLLNAESGEISRNTANGINVSADRFEAHAGTGIGNDNSLSMDVDVLMADSRSGKIALSNAGEIRIEHVRVNGDIELHVDDGDMFLDNTPDIDFDPTIGDALTPGAVINSGYDIGTTLITLGTGNLYALGSLRSNQPDIVGRELSVINLKGEIGTSGRPLVVYVKDKVFFGGLRSWRPIWSFGARPSEFENTSVFQADINQILRSSGELIVNVEELVNIDPAIFNANIRNYNHDYISIKMPKDQLFDDEEDDNWYRLEE